MRTAYLFTCWFFLWQTTALQDITFSIKNDRPYTIILHIGKASMSIQSNSSYRFVKPIGTQVFLVEFGEKNNLTAHC